ncbi:hypothetical protein BH09BAC1_BH09BAC1_00250 [soil metagenome]
MFKYTTSTLKKLEDLCKEAAFELRYEKGSFNAGHCVLEDRRVIVVNQYYTLEARVNCLVDIIGKLDVDKETLSEVSQGVYQKIKHQTPAK